MCGDAATGKRHKRTGVVSVRGRMGSFVRGADPSRALGIVTTENLGVNSLRCDTERCEGLFHLRHEPRWAAKIDVGVSRNPYFVKDRARQVTGKIEVLPYFVVLARSAVADIRSSIRELGHQAVDFAGERMMLAVASCMDPEDLAC